MTRLDNPVILVVMDGFGLNDDPERSAIAAADTPVIDRVLDEYPSTSMYAHGSHVGLPEDALGGSEAGHMQLGGGRKILQMPKRIDQAIESGEFFEKDAFVDAMQHVKQHGSTLHLMGLCSDQAVHSKISHLYALLELADRHDVEEVRIHMFLDGRDTAPQVAERYIQELQQRLEELPGEIATVSGRYYAMDRDRNWERTEKAYRAIVHGKGRTAGDAMEALHDAYERDETDEFVTPTVLDQQGVEDGDAVVFFNFRADRARQLTRCFVDDGFEKFPTQEVQDLLFVSMAEYSDALDTPVAFEEELVKNSVGGVLAARGCRQYRVAESEKEAHVTYFFSGREEKEFGGERRKIFASPDVPTYDETPGMRAEAITRKAVAVMEEKEHDFVLVNLSNCDMVGHTGDFDAAVEATEVVDDCVERIHDACREHGYTLFLTADHGNADEMRDQEGQPLTAHTKNRVPFVLVSDRFEVEFHDEPELFRVGSAILHLNGEELPEEWAEPLFSVR
ncbi:MAG: 2,3-bisphosphoglycerate-independent phosphoglycerate mutase [Candidatus Nanohaloarchaea archaeon]|nr:2,3-bisphosphoglycerate-independent phosphoglycerate mutase [Candidatus Nanohaloarchaea archaeon]